MLNDQGYVAEGSADNVMVRDIGYEVKEELFTRHDVYTAEEVFLTGTAAEVIAVIRVDGRTIGTGVPGPHTNRLLEGFRNKVSEDGVKVFL